MLTIGALGMAFYGLYAVLAGVADLLGAGRLEWWADLWLVLAGTILIFGAVLVRASIPGGLALATAGLLALQSIGLHNAGHLYGQAWLLPELARLLLALVLIALAYFGWDRTQAS